MQIMLLYNFRICLVGDRLISLASYDGKGEGCNNDTLKLLYCPEMATVAPGEPIPIDEHCEYFKAHGVRYITGIPGLSSGVASGKKI